MQIEPCFAGVYDWEISAEEREISIAISYPEGFDPRKVRAVVDTDKFGISVRYPEQPPIVEGKMYVKPESIVVEINEEKRVMKIVIGVVKNTPHPTLCISPHPDTKAMDPLSSFIMFTVLSNSQDEKAEKEALQFLGYGVDAGYVPSLLASASLCQQHPDLQATAIELINIAAVRYNSPTAQFQMGMYYLNQMNNPNAAFDYIEKASRDESLVVARSLLALMLSPLTNMPSPKKDAKVAVDMFESVIIQKEEPLVLHELARLLKNGVGCVKNIERASELNQKAQKIDSTIPDLE